MVRMKDVAQRAGVSVATVSNVITGKRPVSPEMQKAVTDAIHELDYQINTLARGLRTQRTNTIGIILPDVTKLFFKEILRGIIDASNQLGYRISIHNSNYIFEEEKRLVSTLRGLLVDGIIINSCVDSQRDSEWEQEIVKILPDSVPVVSLERDLNPKRISSITIDYNYWTSEVTQHLIDQGHKKIFYISGPSSFTLEQIRVHGYKQALERNGLKVDEQLITFQNFESYSAYHVIRQALIDGREFDAVQTSSDEAAIGAIKALKEAGIQIPSKIAVTGFDNLFPGSLITPALTTVNVPRYNMGYQAVVECVRRINNLSLAPLNINLDCEIIPRNSSVSHVKTDWDLDIW